MKFIVAALIMCIASMVCAQDTKPGQKPPAKAQHGSDKNPISVKVLPAQDAEAQARKQAEEAQERSEYWGHRVKGEHRIGSATWWLFWATFGLVIVTGALWRATYRLYDDASKTSKRQAGETAQALNFSEIAATAAVKSASPILTPYVLTHNFFLHPLERITEPIRVKLALLLSFDNYGKTPARIRQFKGKLHLLPKDEIPRNLDFSTWPPIAYDVIVPGDFRGKDLGTGALDFRQDFVFTPALLDELLAEATGDYQRFALIGHVIYDDVFGKRHTRKYCIKFRVLRQHVSSRNNKGIRTYGHVDGLFQVLKGPSEYNRVITEDIPNPDPLEDQ